MNVVIIAIGLWSHLVFAMCLAARATNGSLNTLGETMMLISLFGVIMSWVEFFLK